MKNSVITGVSAREILSDYQMPAVEVTVTAAGGKCGVASYAEGMAFGPCYGMDLFDGGEHFFGKGMKLAASYINSILSPVLVGMDSQAQGVVDAVILETLSKSGLPPAVNMTSPVSFAVLKAAAAAIGKPLYEHIGGVFASKIPAPGFLCASGGSRYGKHPAAGDRPYYAFVAHDFSSNDEADYALWEIENHWEHSLSREYGLRIQHNCAMAVTSGLVNSDVRLWELMARCINEAGFENKVGLHADFSAGAFYDAGRKVYSGLVDAKDKSRDDMISLVIDMARNHPFVIIQDPLEPNDLNGFAEITRSVDIQVAGCDVFGSDIERLHRCIAESCFNAAILRVYKFPTFSHCARAVELCHRAGIGVMPRDSAGEDEDIVHYAVGFRSGSICMSGLSSHGNRMGLAESSIGPRAAFFGKQGLKGGRFAI